MATISQALAIAVQHHQAGRLATAEQIYRQILAAEPNHADALHLLGVIALQQGKPELAVQHIERAIGLNGAAAVFRTNLGEAYRALRRIPEAVACYRRAVELKPDYAEAHQNLGDLLWEQGKLDEATACYQRTVELKPAHADGYHKLGNALKELGKLEAAVASYRRAVELQPESAAAHSNLGVALSAQGKLDEAVACYRRALELKPDFAEVHHNLAAALSDQGKPDEAVACYRRALELKPDFIEARYHLGHALQKQGQFDEAATSFRRVLQLRPEFVDALMGLGDVLRMQGRLDEATTCFRRAVALAPNSAEAHHNLGVVLQEQLRPDEAAACCRRALQLQPALADAHMGLGHALKDQGKLDEAADCYRRALELRPQFAEAHVSLGSVAKDQGKLDEALACFRQAVRLRPDFHGAWSNELYTLLYCPGYDSQTLYREHCCWNERYAKPLADSIRPPVNDRSPERRLRVGYVSADFREHPLRLIASPLFAAHDHQQFEIFCYADVRRPDAWTARFRTWADVWREIQGLSDAQVAEQVRQDRIDVLVDLGMHMAHHRLLVFARKAAPVQVSWFAYPGTTGLTAIDYRLTDPYLDPPGTNDQDYSERSLRLPDTFWCYDPGTSEPGVSDLPALTRGAVTFGCLNNFCKVNDAVLRLWGRVLRAVDGSRLVMMAPAGSARQRVLELLAEEGIAAERVSLVGYQPRASYLAVYQEIDIGLDTFPYSGHTTSLDSYWMGVPVVTLVGPTVVGRAGPSQLANLGLTDLVAESPEQFVGIAVQLASELGRLAELRATLRQRMQQSPLMDGAAFARNVEAAYRDMWRTWCSGACEGKRLWR